MTRLPDYSFQDRAVECISKDFQEEPGLKTLLVIPTGGGKTRTAIKAILRLHEDGFFPNENHRVLWVAHREELLNQARDAFADEGDHPRNAEALSRTTFISNVPASKEIHQDDNIKLVVIDEAHHAAASTYLPLFRPGVGVLGLTATPSRHDNKPLEFDRESFSIGFPDLERLGIVLRPNVIELEGVTAEISDFSDQQLNTLNTQERNAIIVQALLKHRDIAKKVIVYVGTRQHAKDLYLALSSSELPEHYESISYVTGGDGNNSRGQSRKAFFKEEKGFSRSIIVNVQVLTEGYDDKRVNAVVMAAPFQSKVNYMQCMGRAIRRDDSNPEKEAFVLELTDNLPNIRYRIDNRWIYSELSDHLEPKVIDLTYSDLCGLNEELKALYNTYNVAASARVFVPEDKPDRYQILFFRAVLPSREISHIPLLLNRHNRGRIQNWFNFLSSRIASGKLLKKNREQVLEMVKQWWGDELQDNRKRVNILDAMLNSLEHANPESPWITLVTLKEAPEPKDDSLEAFLHDCLNSADILAQVSGLKDRTGQVVVKFPLPLSAAVARVGSKDDAEVIATTVQQLKELGAEPTVDQFDECQKLLGQVQFPFEGFLLHSLPRLTRWQGQFLLPLA